jgi:S1-C subfamily serine protease
LGYQVARWALDRVGEINNPDAQPRVVTPRGDLASDEKSTIDLYDQNRSSVVHITSLVAARRSRFSLDTMNIPAGTGSGFLWDDSGYIVTNFHVIQEASGAEVTLAGEKTSYKAELVGGYAEMDLAVLKINARGRKLRPIPVGTSSDLKVGQKVFAIGNPFGLDQTLTTGIISALDRELQGESGSTLKNLIQTDAAINPGNSGGPLLDSAGRLIGVNTAILSQNGGSNGLGFAIAVDDVNQIVPQLIRSGRVVRPVIGVSLLGENFARENGIQGLVVRGVEPDGPAAKAGVNVGDIILKINDEEATFHQQASDLIRSLAPAPIDLFVQRAAHDQVLACMQACMAWACTLPTPSPPPPTHHHHPRRAAVADA